MTHPDTRAAILAAVAEGLAPLRGTRAPAVEVALPAEEPQAEANAYAAWRARREREECVRLALLNAKTRGELVERAAVVAALAPTLVAAHGGDVAAIERAMHAEFLAVLEQLHNLPAKARQLGQAGAAP